jgi:hypothetical protein
MELMRFNIQRKNNNKKLHCYELFGYSAHKVCTFEPYYS